MSMAVQSIKFDPILESDDRNKVIDTNLLTAVKLGSLDLLIATGSAWLMYYRKTPKQLSLYLNEKELPVLLEAQNPQEGTVSVNLLTKKKVEDTFIFHIGTDKYLEEQRTKFKYLDENENLEKLEVSGLMTHPSIFSEGNKEKLEKFGDIKPLDKLDSKNKMTLLCNGHIKLNIENKQIDEILDEDMKKAKEKYPEAEVTNTMVGMGPSGGPILGFFINDKLISQIGVTIFFDKTGKQVMEYVLLN